MPLANPLDEFLAERFQSLGLPQSQFRRRSPAQGWPIPAQTQNFPVIPQETFTAAEMAKRTEDRGTLWKVLNILQAGEFAVASFFKSLIQGEKAKADPLTSLWEGFKSGFTSDTEYETRMQEVLTDLGFFSENPKGIVGKSWKFLGGLVAGVAFDPLSYLGIGAAIKSVRIGGKALAAGAKELGVEVTKGYLKGQFFNKLGNKVLTAFKKGKGLLYEPEAMKKGVRLITPMPGATAKEIIEAKGRELLEETLVALGKDVTEENIKHLALNAPRMLLDRGGLRFFKWSLIPGRGEFLTPRASSLRGLVLGDMVESNLPWVVQTAEKVKGSKIWQDLVTPRLEKISRAFRLWHGVSKEVRQVVEPVLQAAPTGKNLGGVATDNLMRYPVGIVKKETRQLADNLGLSVEMLSEAGTKKLTPKQGKLVSRALLDLRDKGADPESVARYFDDLFMNPKHTRRRWIEPRRGRNDIVHLGLLGKTSAEELEGMKFVAARLGKYLPKHRRWEALMGIGSSTDEAYFSRMYITNKKNFDPTKQIDHPWFNKERVSTLDWDQAYEKSLVPGQKEVLGPLQDDLEIILNTRLAHSYGAALEQDAMEAVAAELRKHPATLGEMAKLLNDKKFVGQHPDFAVTIANIADQARVPGIARESLSAWDRALSRLVRQHDPASVPGLVQELLEKAPRNLSEENVQGLLRTFDHALKEKGMDLADIPVTSALYKRNKAAYDAMENARSLVNKTLNTRRLDREMMGIIKQTAEELPDWVGPKSPIAPAFRKSLANVKPTIRSIAKTPTPWIERHFKAISGKLSDAYGLSMPERITLDQAAVQGGKHIAQAKEAVSSWKNFLKRKRMTGEGLRDWRKAREAASSLEAQISNLDKQIKLYSKQKGELLGVTRANISRMMIERESLVELRKALPDTKLFREYNHVVQQVDDLRKLAKEKGAEDYLSAAMHQFFGDQPVTAATPEDIAQLSRMVKGQRNPNQAAVDLLTPPKAGEEFATIAASGKYTVPGAIPGSRVTVDKYVFPKEVARIIGAVTDPKKPGGVELLARQFIDRPLSYFKRLVTSNMAFGIPRIPFFLRNKVDLCFRGTVGFGLDFMLPTYGKYKDTMKILRGEVGEVIINGAPVSYDFIRRRLAQSGMWRTDFARLGTKADPLFDKILDYIDSGRAIAVRDGKERARNYLHGKMPWLRNYGPERWGTNMENEAVIRGFLTQLHAGIPVDQAIQNVQRTLFSYQNLSEFEKSIMRRVIPFYSFSRQAVPFVAWTALKRPALFTFFPRIRDLAFDTSEEEALIPQWIKDFPFIGIGKSTKGVKLLSMRNTFTIDILPDILPTLNADGMRKFLSQVNPLLTIAPELALGKDFYMGRDIETRKTIARGMESTFMRNTIGRWLDFEEVELQGKKLGRVTGWKWHVLRRLFFSRLFRELDTASGVLEKKLDLEEISGVLTGFKIYDIDLGRQHLMLELDAERAKREYDKARKIGDSKRAREIIEEMRLK